MLARCKKLPNLLLLSAALVAGCTSAAVRPVKAPDFLSAWRASIQEDDGLSSRTQQTLRRLDLDGDLHSRPEEVGLKLHQSAVRESNPELLFALAEIHYWLGRREEQSRKPDACHHYYLAAGYAYHYLFGTTAADMDAGKNFGAASEFDPRFRLACDFYNAGLSKCIRAAQRLGPLDPATPIRVPTADGKGFMLSVVHHGFAWRPEEFGPLLFCEDFRVEGLSNVYHSYGLGVPMIGERPPVDPPTPHAWYPRNLEFPVTAFFQFPALLDDLLNNHAGQLDLYNPRTIQHVTVAGKKVPLEADLTTPLAYFLANTELQDAAYDGLLHPDKTQKIAGIYMFEPYQPGKIPVLLVHGLWSSPLTWMPLFNDLQADPVMRERFQFWAYLYPTADPYLTTAADLRQRLAILKKELDPHGSDPALDNMVVVGHSMGGLVARLLTTRSGEDYWHLLTRQPFEKLQIRAETKSELQQTYFFEPDLSVRRVIFLATPHHGSSLSPSWPARIVNHFVRLPTTMVNTLRDLSRSDPAAWPTLAKGNMPTSIDMLAPNSQALELLAAQSRPAGVHYHSVVGVLKNPNYIIEYLSPGGRSKEGTDGIVPYTSAHLPEAESELIVPADHVHVHHHPLAVVEVRRLLYEHLREAEARAVVPVSSSSAAE